VTVNPFVHLNKQFIAGEWRDGATARVLTNRNPYNDKPICTPDEAVRIANHSAFGLSGAIHTKDVEFGAELAKQIDSGAIHINDGTINDEPIVAFGGEKASGFGRLNGRWALEEFTTLKWISVQHTRRHFPFEPR
jgi:acyl-CoA reductase-like NAD-dependent aldehyde dehydrogenase